VLTVTSSAMDWKAYLESPPGPQTPRPGAASRHTRLGSQMDEDSWVHVPMCCYVDEMIKIDKLFCREERAR